MVVTDELAFAVEAVAVAWSRAWLAGVEGLERAEGFPPHVLVPCHPERPELDFQNRVNGLMPDDTAIVPDLLAWYRARHVRPWFELVPSGRGEPLLQALADEGCTALGFHAVVVGRPSAATGADTEAGIEVVDPTDDEAFATFAATRVAGHDLPPEIVEQATADLAGWRHAGGATLYLARVDGEPAATAALTVDPSTGIAYLADGATVPRHRGRGLQSALIGRRLADAAAAGADVVCSQASVDSTSHRNLQRAGLTSGFTKVVLRAGR